MCGVSDDRCKGFSFVRWLSGGYMVGLLVVWFVPLLLLFLTMAGLCCFLRVTRGRMLIDDIPLITHEWPLAICALAFRVSFMNACAGCKRPTAS